MDDDTYFDYYDYDDYYYTDYYGEDDKDDEDDDAEPADTLTGTQKNDNGIVSYIWTEVGNHQVKLSTTPTFTPPPPETYAMVNVGIPSTGKTVELGYLCKFPVKIGDPVYVPPMPKYSHWQVGFVVSTALFFAMPGVELREAKQFSPDTVLDT